MWHYIQWAAWAIASGWYYDIGGDHTFLAIVGTAILLSVFRTLITRRGHYSIIMGTDPVLRSVLRNCPTLSRGARPPLLLGVRQMSTMPRRGPITNPNLTLTPYPPHQNPHLQFFPWVVCNLWHELIRPIPYERLDFEVYEYVSMCRNLNVCVHEIAHAHKHAHDTGLSCIY